MEKIVTLTGNPPYNGTTGNLILLYKPSQNLWGQEIVLKDSLRFSVNIGMTG